MQVGPGRSASTDPRAVGRLSRPARGPPGSPAPCRLPGCRRRWVGIEGDHRPGRLAVGSPAHGVAPGMELRYEEGGAPRSGEGLGKRSRLVEAHRVAAEFYSAALLNLPEARPGRDFLRERGFDRMAADKFGVGFSPRGGEELTKHLRDKGFSDDEIVAAGLASRGGRGLYD